MERRPPVSKGPPTPMDLVRVWNCRRVRLKTASIEWGFQAVTFYRYRRRDGLPCWHVENELGGVHATVDLAFKDGKGSPLPYERHAGTNRLALYPADVFQSAELEAAWRVGHPFALVIATGRVSNRWRVALAHKDGDRWLLVRHLGTVGRSQFQGLYTAKLPIHYAAKLGLPRDAGRLVLVGKKLA